jgi:hypothetical protein
MLEDTATEDEVTYYTLIKKGRKHFAPQLVSTGATTATWIFPVPYASAIGALDAENNGIVLIKSCGYGKDPEHQVIAQNFSSKAYGRFVYRFSPDYSDDTVVYSKTNVAVVANVKTGEAFHAGCGLSTGDFMLGARFLDPQENLFVIAQSIGLGGGRREDCLSIARLEGKKFVDVGWAMTLSYAQYATPYFPVHDTWIVHDRKLFAYNAGQMSCADESGIVRHPFSEIFNSNSNRIGVVKGIAIHPEQPFGVVIEENYFGAHELTLVRWDIADPNKGDGQVLSFSQDFEPLRSLFGMDTMELAYQSFSPDGDWYVVGCISPDSPESPYFVAIPIVPVDKKHPDFLDPDGLVILGQVVGMTSIAWASEPTSYVVSNGEFLYKWDLGELPDARFFAMPDDKGKKKKPLFGKGGR